MAARRAWLEKTVAALAIVALAGFLVYAFLPEPVTADVARVDIGELRVTVGGEAKTRVREVYVVSAPVAGRLLRVESHVGDPVVSGETVLAVLQPAEPEFLDVRSRAQAEARVRAAEAAKGLADAELARAEAELDFAISDLERARALAAGDNISQRALERAEIETRVKRAERATAESSRREAEGELESARAALLQPGQAGEPAAACCVEIRAPQGGRVLGVLQESEAVVTAGTPLIEIGDPADLEIVVDLLSPDAVQVQAGAEVSIDHWGGPGTLHGRVRRVEPAGFTKVSALGIEEQRVNVIVDFTDPPERWRNLGHGYRVEVEIVVWAEPRALKIPLGALFRDAGGWAVYRVVDGRAARAPVELGRRGRLEAQVQGGLAEGDVVIVHPSDKIEDGVRVAARSVAAM